MNVNGGGRLQFEKDEQRSKRQYVICYVYEWDEPRMNGLKTADDDKLAAFGTIHQNRKEIGWRGKAEAAFYCCQRGGVERGREKANWLLPPALPFWPPPILLVAHSLPLHVHLFLRPILY